jgi:hypothetical protein
MIIADPKRATPQEWGYEVARSGDGCARDPRQKLELVKTADSKIRAVTDGMPTCSSPESRRGSYRRHQWVQSHLLGRSP